MVLIDGVGTKGTEGTFYLDWREDGKRIQKPCGVSPREALDAWRMQTAILDGTVEAADTDVHEPVPLEFVSVKTAKATVSEMLQKAGFATIDLGSLEVGGYLQQFPGGPLPTLNLVRFR